MADQKFRGVAVCVDVIGGDDRRPDDQIIVYCFSDPSSIERLQTLLLLAQDERLSAPTGWAGWRVERGVKVGVGKWQVRHISPSGWVPRFVRL